MKKHPKRSTVSRWKQENYQLIEQDMKKLKNSKHRLDKEEFKKLMGGDHDTDRPDSTT